MDSTDIRLRGIIGAAIAAIIIAVGCYSFAFHSFGWSRDTSAWGTFGDYLGGVVGTIFNLIGVVLIYLTFKSQTEFSRLQLENATLQQFESTFFNLLSNQRDIVKNLTGEVVRWDNLTMSSESEKYEGQNYINAIGWQLEDIMDSIQWVMQRHGTPDEQLKSTISGNYEIFYVRKKDQLDHYFRHLYHIVKYTHESEIMNKRKYVDIIQAQMSDTELYLAFYNGLGPYGKRFHTLMEIYSFTQNVRPRGNAFERYQVEFYPITYSFMIPSTQA